MARPNSRTHSPARHELRKALRQARALLTFADEVLSRE